MAVNEVPSYLINDIFLQLGNIMSASHDSMHG